MRESAGSASTKLRSQFTLQPFIMLQAANTFADGGFFFFFFLKKTVRALGRAMPMNTNAATNVAQ